MDDDPRGSARKVSESPDSATARLLKILYVDFSAGPIALIHLLALVACEARLGEVSPWLFAKHPMGNPQAPDGYTWSPG